MQKSQNLFNLKPALFLVFIFIFFPFQLIASKEEQTKKEQAEAKQAKTKQVQAEAKIKEHIFSITLRGEGRLSKNQISKNQPHLYPYIPYAELEFYYSKNENLELLINFEVESQNKNWSIGVDEFSFSYSFKDIPLYIKTGWFPTPLGYMSTNINIFSQDLYFYDTLTSNPEDIGISTKVFLFDSNLSFQVDRMGGLSYREWDNSYNQPESAPFIVSLKSKGSVWDFFLSWFEEDLAFFDPVQAIGAGLNLSAVYKKLSVSIQSEFWQITQDRQNTFSYYVFPSIAIDKIKLGMLFESANHFSPSMKKVQARSSVYERIFQISYQIHPDITIIGERLISSQKKGPLLRDLWSARVKVNFAWSSSK